MRYIDADALASEMKKRQDAATEWLKEAKDENAYARADAILSFLCEVKLTLDKQPTVDVETVRHARWCTTDAFPHRVYCSVCHKTYIPNYHWQVWQDEYDDGGLPRDWCPNCGARMDGGADE